MLQVVVEEVKVSVVVARRRHLNPGRIPTRSLSMEESSKWRCLVRAPIFGFWLQLVLILCLFYSSLNTERCRYISFVNAGTAVYPVMIQLQRPKNIGESLLAFYRTGPASGSNFMDSDLTGYWRNVLEQVCWNFLRQVVLVELFEPCDLRT